MITIIQRTGTWLPLTENWVYHQVRHLPADFDVHVVCRRTLNLDQFALGNIHCMSDEPAWRNGLDHGLRGLGLRRSLSLLTRTAREQRAAIIHSHFGDVGWHDMEAVRKSGARHVVNFYGVDVNHLPSQYPKWQARYRELFSEVDAVLCEGEHMGRCVVALGCPEEKLRVNHLGVSLDGIPFEPAAYREGEPLRVLIAGSFREKKGIPIALEALARLRDSVALEITLIGDAGKGSRSQGEKRRIEAAIANHRFGDSLRTLGYLPYAKLMEEARRHHIFLSPSITAHDGDTEGGAPVSLIDMAASGLLIVSTKHCDIPAIVRHGETGLLSEERDIDGLIANLQYLVDNPGQWDAMRTAARKHVEHAFDARIQAEKLAKIYKSLIR